MLTQLSRTLATLSALVNAFRPQARRARVVRPIDLFRFI